MLYSFYGTDLIKSRKKYQALLDALLVKNPQAELFLVNKENFDRGRFEELIVGQTLFYSKYLVGCDNLLDDIEILTAVKKHIKDIAASANVFVFLENHELKEGIKLLGKYATKSQEINLLEKKETAIFNLFTLTDAISARNPTLAWTLYEEALRRGLSPDEIYWKVIWVIKNLLLVKSDAKKDLKLNPYVLKKAELGAKNYRFEELAQLSSRLTSLYHTQFPDSEGFELELEEILAQL